MNKKGFTLFETMVSVTIFSVLMIIVFNCWTEFQKVSLKNEGKHDTNIQFANVYRNIDRVVCSSSTRLFKCYSDSSVPTEISTHQNKRWFAFFVSRTGNNLDDDFYYDSPKYEEEVVKLEDGAKKTEKISREMPLRIIYNTVVVYLLHYKDNCCGDFKYCPHKSIYRYVYKAKNDIYFGNVTLCNWGLNFQEELQSSVNAILSNPDSKPYSIIENNLVDMTIEKTDDKFKFVLTVLRENDAERHFQIGTRDLVNANAETKKYIENLSWVSIPSNT